MSVAPAAVLARSSSGRSSPVMPKVRSGTSEALNNMRGPRSSGQGHVDLVLGPP